MVRKGICDPLLKTLPKVTGNFKFAPPDKIEVIGSFASGTITTLNPTIDVMMVLPKVCYYFHYTFIFLFMTLKKHHDHHPSFIVHIGVRPSMQWKLGNKSLTWTETSWPLTLFLLSFYVIYAVLFIKMFLFLKTEMYQCIWLAKWKMVDKTCEIPVMDCWELSRQNWHCPKTKLDNTLRSIMQTCVTGKGNCFLPRDTNNLRGYIRDLSAPIRCCVEKIISHSSCKRNRLKAIAS